VTVLTMRIGICQCVICTAFDTGRCAWATAWHLSWSAVTPDFPPEDSIGGL
jgi:hypothetical protein